ncbi:hypothetical protein ACFQ0X_03000 [Streptomyces rectiviolaceus]|uniref:Uncharacterized protein n=1 Tax=Streptomyces rectiviolaceus TaxID=332591 RepID=A0ABP6MCZ9_9ACTN
MDDTERPLADPPQGQLLTGAYWLDAPPHAGDECVWCSQLMQEGAKPEQRVRMQAD